MLYYPVARSGRFDIEPIPLQTGLVGDVVSFSLVSFLTADAPSVSWSVVGGALPPGISLSTAGVVSGTIGGTGGAFVAMVQADAGGSGVAVQAVAFSITPTSVSADQEAVFSGGVTRNWTDDFGVSMVAADLLTSGSFTVSRAGWGNLTGCASGGAGGNINNNNGSACGGGGAGQFLDGRVWLPVGTYTVSIGAAAAPGTPGNNTTITGPGGFSITLLGGGVGAAAYGNGGAGASGGGGSGSNISQPAGAATSQNTGQNGGAGNGTSGSRVAGGGGGFGAPGAASNGTSAGNGGGGVRKKLWAWLDFCGGGGGGTSTSVNGLGRNGGGNGGLLGASGTSAQANTGSGGGGAGNRASGTAVLTGGLSGSGRMIVWGRVTA
jgi:hypothetical protein